MQLKHKIFGLSLALFMAVFLWLLLKPKEGISSLLFEAKNIDSIIIRKSDSTVTLKEASDIINITKNLKKLALINPERIKINTGLIHLYFFVNRKTFPVIIIYSYYDGIVINANDLYYKNDTLNKVVLQYLQKRKSIIIN